MDFSKLLLKYSKEQDVEALRNAISLLVKCQTNGRKDSGYCVVNDHFTSHTYYYGGRASCVAFVDGYEAAPRTDEGCFDSSVMCVCVDTPSRMIVIPEERFGEELCPGGKDGRE